MRNFQTLCSNYSADGATSSHFRYFPRYAVSDCPVGLLTQGRLTINFCGIINHPLSSILFGLSQHFSLLLCS